MNPVLKIILTFCVMLFISCGIFVAWQLTDRLGEGKTDEELNLESASKSFPDTGKKTENNCEKNLKKLFAENTSIEYEDECTESITKWTEPFMTGLQLKNMLGERVKPFEGVWLRDSWEVREYVFGGRLVYLIPWTYKMFFNDVKRYIPQQYDENTLEKIRACNKGEEGMRVAATVIFYSPFEGTGLIQTQASFSNNAYVQVYFENGLMVEGMERDFPRISSNPYKAWITVDKYGNLARFFPQVF